MRIDYLNHASVIIRTGEQSLLFDPWFSGTAFAGGWGLQYDNPDALQKAAACTHLWIQRAGFTNITPLYERRKLALTSSIKVTRYPTAGIDNMLLIETPEGTILNYNDCHLPIDALKSLMRRIGKVDVLLSNFNHAIKFIDNPRKSDEQIRNELKTSYKKVLDAINPAWAIPFASAHYYRTRATVWQNNSLLDSEDLVELDSRILPLRIGSEVTFDDKLQPTLSPVSARITPNARDIKVEQESVPFDEVVQAAKGFGDRLRQSLLGLTFWIPELRIRVEECQRVIRFDVNNQVYAEDHRADAHLQAHSSSLHQWFMKPYGADSFFIGGHFEVVGESTTPIRRVLLACSLMEKRLSPRSLMQYMLRTGGIKFLLNRREEILVTLGQRRLRVGNRV